MTLTTLGERKGRRYRRTSAKEYLPQTKEKTMDILEGYTVPLLVCVTERVARLQAAPGQQIRTKRAAHMRCNSSGTALV